MGLLRSNSADSAVRDSTYYFVISAHFYREYDFTTSQSKECTTQQYYNISLFKIFDKWYSFADRVTSNRKKSLWLGMDMLTLNLYTNAGATGHGHPGWWCCSIQCPCYTHVCLMDCSRSLVHSLRLFCRLAALESVQFWPPFFFGHLVFFCSTCIIYVRYRVCVIPLMMRAVQLLKRLASKLCIVLESAGHL